MSDKLRKMIKYLSYNGYLNLLTDRTYLKLLFYAQMNRKLDLQNPITYNEKLQWIKIYDKNPEYTRMIDKFEAKKFVSDIIGEQYIIPTIGVWDSADEVDIHCLPEQFVLKCTHDSGNVIICKDRNKFDEIRAKHILQKALKKNYYFEGREWPYKHIKPRVIAEPFIGSNSRLPNDYKIFTFGGKVDSIMVCTEREKSHPLFYFYDCEWNRLIYQHPEYEKKDNVAKPHNLDEMITVAEKLSEGIRHIRVDLYNTNGKIYFGELTFFNQSGFDTDITYSTDLMWGNKIVF